VPRIPETPDEVFNELTSDFQKAYGDKLEGIFLYGSGAKGQYVPGQSDLNFLVVLSPVGINALHYSLAIVEKWRKRNVAVPLVLTANYIKSALDTFPIEFLDMREFHQVVYGEDMLSDISIDTTDLRRQIERELRGKLIYLREGFLSTGMDREAMRRMVASSVPAFTAIFAALLFLKNQEAVRSRSEIVEQVCDIFGLDVAILKNILNVRSDSWRGSTVQLQELTQRYISEIRKLVEIVDKM
jgi:predicted nucleotidyltransferase